MKNKCEYLIWEDKTDYKCLIGESIIPYKGMIGRLRECGEEGKEYSVYKKMKKGKPEGAKHNVCLCEKHYELVLDNTVKIKEEI
jgi:hypothetical protein